MQQWHITTDQLVNPLFMANFRPTKHATLFAFPRLYILLPCNLPMHHQSNNYHPQPPLHQPLTSFFLSLLSTTTKHTHHSL